MPRIIRRVMPSKPRIQERKRVAGYARVSDGKSSMLQSLSAQVSYYSELIQRNPLWQYAGVYADEAVTGTKDERPEFQRLLSDCRAGKIDMVITKSISRFARNTVTLLETVRELKAQGVDVFFEEQNIHTMSGDGELMLTILASYAQEESRSVSENCTWRIRKNFERGIPRSTPIFGYKIERGEFTLIPEEVAIVRMVFQDYLSGMSCDAIQRKLNSQGAPTKLGGKWTDGLINVMLHNEKYAGDLLLQKFFRVDHLSKCDHRNRGELPRYYVRDHHEAIIERRDFDRAQEILKARNCVFHAYDHKQTRYPFSGKIICERCGKAYNRKITHGKAAWVCSTFLRQGKAHCHAKQIPEDILMNEINAVLGKTEFDEGAFCERIQHICVPAFNRLIFVFHDGKEIERIWQDKSRKDSWTDAMKARAAIRAQKENEYE